MNQLILTKPTNSRRRSLKIRRLKYTYQARTHFTIACGDGENLSAGKKRETVNEDVSYHGVNEAKASECSRMEISLSLTSSSDNLSPKNEVLLSAFKDNNSKETKDIQTFPRISYGSVSAIGRRSEMEDAVRVELGFMNKGGEKYDFFGVYDGHGGASVAEACRERLHRLLEEEIMEGKEAKAIEWERVMEGCFQRMDEEVAKDRTMGSTAVVAVMGREEVVVANCGDSRAVLSRAGVAVPLSVDHKPDRPDELERVEAAGGRVINWKGSRVLGVLATSRSIGDDYLKPFVISKPEVMVNKRSEEDEFLILASDGLWDVLSNEVACQVVRRCLSGRMRRKLEQKVVTESRAAEAAAVLAELAMARGSEDNISVIVVELKKPTSTSSC